MNACPKCKGEGWVCEAHPDRPWEGDDHPDACPCGAPGMQCPACLDPVAVLNLTGEAANDVELEIDECAQCHRSWPHDPALPPCSTDDHGVRMIWCSDACAEAWLEADPKRRDGWIDVRDLPPEYLGEKLAEVGIHLDGVGPRRPS